MDVLAQFLDGPRARDAFLLRMVFSAPFSMRIEDEAPLSVLAVARGEAWVVYEHEEPQRLVDGDVAVMRGPTPFSICDAVGRPNRIVVRPGNVCQTLWGEPLYDRMSLGVRTWGDDAHGDTVMLTGVYEHVGEAARLLLDPLPTVLVVRGDDGPTAVAALLAAEMQREGPAQQVVLDRLLDLVLIDTLRRWFDARPSAAPRWYAGHADPVVGAALQAVHSQLDDDWTVERLARAIGVSRASLARRFAEVIGEPPMTYLRSWRMAVAADLLVDPSRTVTSVAAEVGYRSPFTFSAAFKRHFGASPTEFHADRRKRPA